MQKVSAVLITHNEEYNLSLSLPKLTWCDEIVIVDSGSTDNTIRLCHSFNCKVYEKPFQGYGDQKRYAVSLAKNDWVLCLDADEILSDELVAELKTEMINPLADAYSMPMVLLFMNNRFKYGKESWRYFTRLFNKTKGGFNSNKVHEKIEVNGTYKKLQNPIDHYSYRSFSQYLDKLNRYTSYGAETAHQNGKRKGAGQIVVAIPLNFLKYYFLHKNFLNGLHGFYWSVLNAFYHFMKYLKTKELYTNNPVPVESEILNSGITKPIFNTDIQRANITAA